MLGLIFVRSFEPSSKSFYNISFMKEKKLKTIGNTVLIHHVFRRYNIQNGWLWQEMHTLSCAVYGTANPLVSSYMPLGLGLRFNRVMARVAVGRGIFAKRISSHLRICSVGALSMKAQSSKKVILKIVLLTVATFVNKLGGKTKFDS
jgi:hypothetical protein